MVDCCRRVLCELSSYVSLVETSELRNIGSPSLNMDSVLSLFQLAHALGVLEWDSQSLLDESFQHDTASGACPVLQNISQVVYNQGRDTGRQQAFFNFFWTLPNFKSCWLCVPGIKGHTNIRTGPQTKGHFSWTKTKQRGTIELKQKT